MSDYEFFRKLVAKIEEYQSHIGREPLLRMPTYEGDEAWLDFEARNEVGLASIDDCNRVYVWDLFEIIKINIQRTCLPTDDSGEK